MHTKNWRLKIAFKYCIRNWIPNLINKSNRCEKRRPGIMEIASKFFKEDGKKTS